MLVLWLWPGARWSTVSLCYALVLALSVSGLRLCAWRSHAACMIVLVAVTALFIGVTVNVNYYTYGSGGSITHPMLRNSDAYRIWWAGVALIAEDVHPSYYMAYPTWILLKLFGRDFFMATVLQSSLFASLSLVVTGELAWQLTRRRDVALGAMLGMSLMCYFMVQGTLLIKDDALVLGMGLAALGIVRLCRCRGAGDAASWLPALAGVALMFYRPNFLLFIVLGAVIFGLRRRPDLRLAALSVIAVAVWIVIVSNIDNPDPVKMAASSERAHVMNTHTSPWDDFIGYYPALSVLRKLVLLPASVAVQFLIPFPWNYGRDMIFGPTLAVAHFGYTWYLAGGVFLYWLFGRFRRSPVEMRLLAIWYILMYAGTAFGYSGRVSRYCLPYLPLIIPIVSCTVIDCWRSRRFITWMGVFAALMTVTLLVCHSIHTGR